MDPFCWGGLLYVPWGVTPCAHTGAAGPSSRLLCVGLRILWWGSVLGNGQPFRNGRACTASGLFSLGSLGWGGREFTGSHWCESSLLNVKNVPKVDYNLYNWVCGGPLWEHVGVEDGRNLWLSRDSKCKSLKQWCCKSFTCMVLSMFVHMCLWCVYVYLYTHVNVHVLIYVKAGMHACACGICMHVWYVYLCMCILVCTCICAYLCSLYFYACMCVFLCGVCICVYVWWVYEICVMCVVSVCMYVYEVCMCGLYVCVCGTCV